MAADLSSLATAHQKATAARVAAERRVHEARKAEASLEGELEFLTGLAWEQAYAGLLDARAEVAWSNVALGRYLEAEAKALQAYLDAKALPDVADVQPHSDPAGVLDALSAAYERGELLPACELPARKRDALVRAVAAGMVS